ncbi:MAG: glycine betaine ABC transporter substrate-binding protein [bacterium]
MSLRHTALVLLFAAGGFAAAAAVSADDSASPPPRVMVGAKKFTESAVLAELMAQVLEAHTNARVERTFNLAGTQVCFDALRSGAIDLYAEYTGTGLRNILGDDGDRGGAAAVYALVSETFRSRFDLLWLAPFGFDNTYVLMMQPDRAAALGVTRLGDLAAHPLRYGMSHEFNERPDGMPGLRKIYGLNESSTVGMEHDLAYQALADGAIDISDGYSTDAKILAFNLLVLKDDRAFFPPYEAAPLVRADLFTRVPGADVALRLLAGRLDAATMRRLNFAVEGEHRDPAEVAAEFLRSLGLATREIAAGPRAEGFWRLMWQRRWVTLQLTGQHLVLTGVALCFAVLIGVPLGIAASRRPRLATVALTGAGIAQTIPSIALLAFMLPWFGIGVRPAIVALFLYGLLPILRNTVAGLRGVDAHLLEVGRGLGMRARDLLWRVELPLAAPVLMAGIRTAAVISVGTATLAAFIGAGGLGDPIVTGLSVTDTNLVLSGALPAAVLAMLVDAALHAVERFATPRGLRVVA